MTRWTGYGAAAWSTAGMVRVFTCHHFLAQNVIPTDAEPIKAHCYGNLLFVSTASRLVEVYSLEGPTPQKITAFPTIGSVTEIAYCAVDDYIATLETTNNGADKQVRLYFSWQPTSRQQDQPIRATIAGHRTSIRHPASLPEYEDGIEVSQVHVTGLPLKDTPTCLTVDSHTGNLAIAIRDKLLIYALSRKTAASSSKIYEDVKCVLELQFHFVIRSLDLCEEIIVVCSNRETQVVQLNLKHLPDMENIKQGMPVVRGEEEDEENKELRAEEKECVKALRGLPVKNTKLNSNGGVVGQKCYYSEDTVITDDVDCVDWDFNQNNHTLILKSVQDKVAEGGGRNSPVGGSDDIELIGPLLHHRRCPVSVEYEDTCGYSDAGSEGLLERGVSTLLYHREGATFVHSPQLLPVYSKHDHTAEAIETFTSPQRRLLAGVYVYFSTAKYGRLYSLMGKVQHLDNYLYTSSVTQVVLSGSLVYAMSATGLEVYTARCVAHAIQQREQFDGISGVLPSVELEPCLIGIQPFIGLQSLAGADDHLVLLSKIPATQSLVEDSWSVYALQKPSTADLYTDIHELARSHQRVSTVAYSHLLQEAQLLLRAHLYLHGNHDIPSDIIKESATEMGHHHARGSEPQLCVPYFMMAGLPPGELLKNYTPSHSPGGGAGVLRYLDHILLAGHPTAQVTQVEGDAALNLYSREAPHNLPLLLLGSALTAYTPETALKLVADDSVKHKDKSREKSVNVLSVLCCLASVHVHLDLRQRTKAADVLNTLSEDAVMSACLHHPRLVFDLRARGPDFSKVFKFLVSTRKQVAVQSLVAMVTNRVLTIEDVSIVIKVSRLQGMLLLEFLEALLVQRAWQRAAMQPLCEEYITRLQQPSPQSTVHCSPLPASLTPPRHAWLDRLPPLTAQRTPRARPKWVVWEGQGSPKHLTKHKGETDLSTDLTTPSAEGNPKENNGKDFQKEILVKLQTLLCSSQVTPGIQREILMHIDTACKETTDAFKVCMKSARLLCYLALEPKVAIATIVKLYPRLLVEVCRHGVKKDDLPIVVTAIWNQMIGVSMETRGRYQRALADVMTICAAHLPTETFHTLLPPEGVTEFCQPHVAANQRASDAKKLEQDIQQLARVEQQP